MKTLVYSFHTYEKNSIDLANSETFELQLLESRLSIETAALAKGYEAVCLFVSDDASAPVLDVLYECGVRLIAMRCAGYNNVDLVKAKELGMRVARVAAYSPYAVAEHAVAMMMALNRHLIRAHNRVMEQNFSLNGLTGFDMYGKTVGIIGAGKIGGVVARIMNGFGCLLLGFDPFENTELTLKYDLKYTTLEELCRQSDIISLHLPLTPDSHHLISKDLIHHMKDGVMLINTSRGGLVDTKSVVQGLKTGKIGYFGMDVYEEEAGLFFEDHSNDILQDDTVARLMTFQNVLITSHQGFLTDTALHNIAQTTIENLRCFSEGRVSENEIG